ncbi:helix-turn-helix domain-containing protein [Stratiformator vulcanicus]|uniref:Helix-turn-helix domain protein n=1 Tax=Stratiformator vulcanicus TaxID=2527980 RepID=A0A517R5T8_9PLAN|nr:helix-turn-helix domain-containing protein [Stratiformator vulcanicus]QDT39232.1 Helix-turn-helix domain protein [Stratiformator vulcanicus]
MDIELDKLLTTAEVAERLGIRQHSVVDLINSDQLRGIDVSLKPGGRPTWRVHPDDLEGFIARRTKKQRPARKRRKRNPAVREYY